MSDWAAILIVCLCALWVTWRVWRSWRHRGGGGCDDCHK